MFYIKNKRYTFVPNYLSDVVLPVYFILIDVINVKRI